MTLENGFVKFDRKIQNWGWYKNCCTFNLFFHLIITANFTDGNFEGIEIKRGQRVASYRTLSEESGLSIKQVRTAINHLKGTQEVAQVVYPKFSVFTVINYNKYQQGAQTWAQEGHARGTLGAQEGQQYKKDKKEKNDKKEYNTSAFADSEELQEPNSFDFFWEAYPKKTAKSAAVKIWDKLNPDGNLISLILQALEKQKRSEQWTKDNGQFIPYPTTWLNQKRWEDETEVTIKSDSIESAPSYDSALFDSLAVNNPNKCNFL